MRTELEPGLSWTEPCFVPGIVAADDAQRLQTALPCLLRQELGDAVRGVGYRIDLRSRLVSGVLVAENASDSTYARLFELEATLAAAFPLFDFDFRVSVQQSRSVRDCIPPSYLVVEKR